MNLKKDLSRYLDAGFPILYINSFEESKVEETIRSIADRWHVSVWGIAKGYGEYYVDDGKVIWSVPQRKDEMLELHSVLESKLMFEGELNRTIFILRDAHIALKDEQIVAYLKEISVRISNGCDCCIMLISPIIKIPTEIEKYITILESDYLEYEDIQCLIGEFTKENDLPDLKADVMESMATAFKGLSQFEIQNLLALAVADDGELDRKDLPLIFEQKKQMIMKSGILEMIPLKERIEDIGGLENLKEWLKRKAKVICNMQKAKEFGVEMPKGVLIAGVPGCGKSLCAKAAASLFNVPILRLDVGKLMGKYLGESEGNLRKAINLAEAISPCVLWVDELEKAFAGIGSEGGHEVTSRLFGTFLTWMQEKTSPTFVVATANDITKLPPELLRKGRFDEIFFVGLPKNDERRKIFRIHIAKRRPDDIKNINIDELVSLTTGYSGADIEGVVKDGIEHAFAGDRAFVTTDDIKHAIKNTNSLSVIMRESLDKIVKEYERRKLKNASA